MNANHRCLIWMALILASAGLLFAPSLRFPFTWDDTAVVRDNPFIHRPAPAGLYFQPGYWRNLVPVSRSDYRPLQMLTLAAIARAGGRDPFCYRAANLLLHLLAVGLVFVLGRRLGTGEAASLLAAALFAFHPVHVETIVGARNISELMSSVLLLSALILFFPGGSKRARVLPLLLFAAALLYKESALILPPILAALILGRPGGIRDRRKALAATLPFWILAAAAGIAKLFLSSGAGPAGAIPAPHLAAGASRLMAASVRLLVFPARLKVLYHFPRPESWAQPVWFFSLAGAGLLAGILVSARRNRRLFSLLLALAASLLPSLYRLGTAGRVVAEQRLYLPSFFFCLAAAVLIRAAAGSSRRMVTIALLGWLLCLPLAGLTGSYLRAWRGELPLWSRVTTLSPRAGIAFNNLAIALFRDGDRESARRQWERALEVDPGLAEAHTNLGVLEGRENRWAEAADHFQDALDVEPFHRAAGVYLAQAWRRQGRYEAAEELLRGILAENPFHAEALNELAFILERTGGREEAENLYREAAALNPDYAAPLRHLAELHLQAGDFEPALEAGREAVDREPGHPQGYVTLADIYIAQGRLDEARNVLEAGESRHPGDWRIRSRRLALDSLSGE